MKHYYYKTLVLATLLFGGVPSQIMAQSGAEDYPINFSRTAGLRNADRRVTGVSLSGNMGSASAATVPTSPLLMYHDLSVTPFSACLGETVTTAIVYAGQWMHGYTYLDEGRDGTFSSSVDADGRPEAGSDLKTFSYYKGKNSAGTTVSGNVGVDMPSFTISSDLTPGVYLMRLKVDWDDIDPGGSTQVDNDIARNSGSIIDVPINIHGTTANVTATGVNGSVKLADGTTLTAQTMPFGKGFEVTLEPNADFKLSEIIIRHGYFDGDSLVHGVAQYRVEEIPAFLVHAGRYTVPAEYVDGDVQIAAYFVKAETPHVGEDYAVNFNKESVVVTRTDRSLTHIAVNVADGNVQQFKVPSDVPTPVYADVTSTKVFAKPGQRLTPGVTYITDAPMHGYFYIDYDQDGSFSAQLRADHTPTAASELVSYSYYDGYNSAGEASTADATTQIAFPAFNLPNLPAGVYRARLKVDYNNIDPAGQYDGVADIDKLGGRIVDFLLCVTTGAETISIDTRNGNVYTDTDAPLPVKTTVGADMGIKPTPVAQGYVLDTLYVKHGLNFDGPAVIRGNRQWSVDTIPAASLSSSLAYTILAQSVDGNIAIQAYFRDNGAAYKLVWSDEFNTEGRTKPDAAKWQSSLRLTSTWNRFITDSIDVAHVENGSLVLRAIPNTNQAADPVAFLTGAIESQGKFSFMHGKLEARAITNPFTGNFPAIWMMPKDQTGGWPTCGEIDIFEQIDAENRSYHTVHSHWTYDLGHRNTPPSSFSYNADMTIYHTYGLEWNSDTLAWYVDGKLLDRYLRHPENEAEGQWPFEKEFYIILNQSVGNGSWAKNPVTGHTYETKIDWIRVYQLDETTGIRTGLQDSDAVSVSSSRGRLTVTASATTAVRVSDLVGRTCFNGKVSGTLTINLPRGWYIVNAQKVWIP